MGEKSIEVEFVRSGLWQCARRLAIIALSIGTLLAQTTAPPDRAAHLLASHREFAGVKNFGEVTPTLYRGGHATKEGFRNLAKMGINIVVDSGRSTRDEPLVTSLGMRYVSLPWYCPFPKDKVFADFLKLIKQNPNKKIFVHCRLGEDRTGMMIASYRIAVQGWSAQEAMREMHDFGYRGLHHLICPGLGRYEKSFPKRLETHPLFQETK